MIHWLLLLFIGVPCVELYLLYRIGTLIGIGPTVGIVLLTGIVGTWLARREGRKTLFDIRNKLSSGTVPSDQLVDGLIILLSGALLITPGVATDAVGFLGLIPWTRSWIRGRLQAWFRDLVDRGSVQVNMFGSFDQFGDTGVNQEEEYDIDVTPEEEKEGEE